MPQHRIHFTNPTSLIQRLIDKYKLNGLRLSYANYFQAHASAAQKFLRSLLCTSTHTKRCADAPYALTSWTTMMTTLAAHIDHGDIARPPQSALVASPRRHDAGESSSPLVSQHGPSQGSAISFRTCWCFTRYVLSWEDICCAVLHRQRARMGLSYNHWRVSS